MPGSCFYCFSSGLSSGFGTDQRWAKWRDPAFLSSTQTTAANTIQQAEAFTIIRCQRYKHALYQWLCFLAKLIQSVTKHTESNFLKVWILPTFAVMSICPSVAFLRSGSDKFLKSLGYQNCLEMGRREGIMAITLFLSHLAWNCHELRI